MFYGHSYLRSRWALMTAQTFPKYCKNCWWFFPFIIFWKVTLTNERFCRKTWILEIAVNKFGYVFICIPNLLPSVTMSTRNTRVLRAYRFTTYQDARRVRLVNGLETNILRVSPVKLRARVACGRGQCKRGAYVF